MNIKKTINWILNKIIKLIPLYYVALVLCLLLMGGSSYWLGSEKHVSILNILSHLFFFHGFFPHYINSIITVEWYLSVLIVIYIIVPIIHKYIDNLSKSITLYIVATFICSLVIFILNKKLLFPNDFYLYSTYINDFNILSQLPVILLGIVLYFLIQKNNFNKVNNKRSLSLALLLFAFVMILGEAFFKNNLLFITDKTRFGLWFLIIIISLNIYNYSFIDNIIFRFFGKHSFPIYLFHKLIIFLYDKYIHINIGNHYTISWGIKYIIVIGISSVLSLLMIRFIEKPILNFINSVQKKKQS